MAVHEELLRKVSRGEGERDGPHSSCLCFHVPSLPPPHFLSSLQAGPRIDNSPPKKAMQFRDFLRGCKVTDCCDYIQGARGVVCLLLQQGMHVPSQSPFHPVSLTLSFSPSHSSTLGGASCDLPSNDGPGRIEVQNMAVIWADPHPAPLSWHDRIKDLLWMHVGERNDSTLHW